MSKKFLDDLTDEERTEFLAFCEKKVFLADQEIIRKGDTSRVLFLIQQAPPPQATAGTTIPCPLPSSPSGMSLEKCRSSRVPPAPQRL